MLMELGALTIKSVIFGVICLAISAVAGVGLFLLLGGWFTGATMLGEAYGFLPWLLGMTPIALLFFGFVAWLLKG